MANQEKSYYVGNAKELPKGGMKIQLNLSQLFEYTSTDATIKGKIKSFKTKDGKEQKTLDIVVFPLKEPGKYNTHSVKIDTWEKPEGFESKSKEDSEKLPF
jgi:hypothetical protein